MEGSSGQSQEVYTVKRLLKDTLGCMVENNIEIKEFELDIMASTMEKVIARLTTLQKMQVSGLSLAQVKSLKRKTKNMTEGFYSDDILTRTRQSLIALGPLPDENDKERFDDAFKNSKIIIDKKFIDNRSTSRGRRKNLDPATPVQQSILTLCTTSKRLGSTGISLVSDKIYQVSSDQVEEYSDHEECNSIGKNYTTKGLFAPFDSLSKEYLESYTCLIARPHDDFETMKSHLEEEFDYYIHVVKTPSKLSNFLNPDALHIAYIKSKIWENEGWINITEEFITEQIDILREYGLGILSKDVCDRYEITAPEDV